MKMSKLNEKDIVAIVDEQIKEDRKNIQLEAEISVCESILGLIRNITNEIKTLDDLDTFICAMISNRQKRMERNEAIKMRKAIENGFSNNNT